LWQNNSISDQPGILSSIFLLLVCFQQKEKAPSEKDIICVAYRRMNSSCAPSLSASHKTPNWILNFSNNAPHNSAAARAFLMPAGRPSEIWVAIETGGWSQQDKSRERGTHACNQQKERLNSKKVISRSLLSRAGEISLRGFVCI
jgi:hypothetical protein